MTRVCGEPAAADEAGFAAAIDARLRSQARPNGQAYRAIGRDDDHDISAAGRELRIIDEMERERARREARRRLNAEERGPQADPVIETLRDRLARPRTETAYRIEGWQPLDSRGILAAQYKAGKTTLIGCLLRSLVDGDPFLGRHAVTPIDGTVALIDNEMAPRQIDGWLGDQRIQNDDRVTVIPLRGAVSAFDPIDLENRARWTSWLRELRTAYLIIDCFRPMLDGLGLDEHKDAGRLLVAIDALMADAGIREGTIVHHMGHVAERARGDSRIRDWPDYEWRLVRQDDDPASQRFLSAFGRDVDQPESALAWDPLTRRLTLAGGTRQDAKTREALAVVRDLLREAPTPMSTRQIVAALSNSDQSDHAIRAALKAGVRDREILTQPGPRAAILHRLAEAVSQCVAPCQERVSHGESECVSASIGDALHTHAAPLSDSAIQPTHSPASPRRDPWADTPRPPGSVEAAERVAARRAATDRPRARR